MSETSWNSLGETINGEKYASFSSDERTYIAMVYRLKKQFPDEIIIKAEPKENNGCIYAWIPAKYLRIAQPRKLNLSEEEKEKRRTRLMERMAAKDDPNPEVSSGIEEEKLPFTDLLDDLTLEAMEREFNM